MKKTLAAAAAAALLLCGCNTETESSEPVSTSSSTTTTTTTTTTTSRDPDSVPAISIPAQSYPGASSAYEIAAASTTTLEIIEKAEPTERHDGDRLEYKQDKIFSAGKYYSVIISGAKCEDQKAGTNNERTFVKDTLYGDFRLDLLGRSGEVISTLKINVPKDDLFLILESAADGIDYGCSLVSSKSTYGSDDYPDIIQLDFYRKSDYEVPQYARYFAVIGNEITELDIYENGALVSPRGTHPELREAGMFIQHLCVKNGRGGYEVIRYEYRFDVQNKRLNRKRVRFTGWNT